MEQVPGDTPITEQICELKRKDVKGIGKQLEEFREEFKQFTTNDFKHLEEKIGTVCTQAEGFETWARTRQLPTTKVEGLQLSSTAVHTK